MSHEVSPGKPTTRRYSEAEKERAVRAVRQLRKELGSDHGTVKRPVPAGHPLRTRSPHRYLDPVLPEPAVPGSREVFWPCTTAWPRCGTASSE